MEFSSAPVWHKPDARPCCCGLKLLGQTVRGSQPLSPVRPKRSGVQRHPFDSQALAALLEFCGAIAGQLGCSGAFRLDKAVPTSHCAAMNIRLTGSLVENVTGRKLTRRRFLGGTIAAATCAPMLSVTGSLAQQSAPGTAYERKIKLGVIGNGGRGSWIANLFKKHSGYEMHAVADYFQEVADQCGDKLGVDKARRFSTLSGYNRLLECGVEAVALEPPPYFFPEHAKAAVDAGLHVYMAKPVAVDVPGALQILAAAKEAARKKRCFLVDYQMPTDPANNEVLRRLRTPEFGPISQVATVGIGGGFQDPPKGDTIENRLRG